MFKAIRKTPRSYAGRLDLDLKKVIRKDQFEFTDITLIAPEDFEYTPKITPADKKAAQPIEAKTQEFSQYYIADLGLMHPNSLMADAAVAQLPAVVDNRINQSPVKNQVSRDTCVSHAAMALLEAFPHIEDNLSEQYTHYKFNDF